MSIEHALQIFIGKKLVLFCTYGTLFLEIVQKWAVQKSTKKYKKVQKNMITPLSEVLGVF